MFQYKKFHLLLGFMVLLVVFFLVYYQYDVYFQSMEEGFISDSYTDFAVNARYIQEKIRNVYPYITINLTPKGEYFSRITDVEMDIYKENGNRWSWDEETMKVYRQFLYEQGYKLSADDFKRHTDKLRTVYNQYMILELMSHETDQGQIFHRGLIVDSSNNIVKPLPKQYNEWTEYYTLNNDDPAVIQSQSVIKCKNKQLKKFSASSSLSSSQVGVDVSLSDLTGVVFGDYANRWKCNPCEVMDVSKNYVPCSYRINFAQPIDYDIFQLLNKSRLT